MKLVNYALQNQIENLSEVKTNSFFKDYIQTIIEDTSKPYYQRADYVGLSLNELKLKIEYLSSNIKEFQNLKKVLSQSLEIAKELTAEVFENNGIDRIDGNIISSLTILKSSSKTTQTITVKDPNAVMGLGYVKFDVDVEAIQEAIKSDDKLKELEDFIEIKYETINNPAKVKVNTKRASNNTNYTDEILTIKHEIA